MRLQRPHRSGRGRTQNRRMAGGQARRQRQHHRHHRRARNVGRHAAHQGGKRSLRQASRHQDRRRSGRHVEPGRGAHRTLKILATQNWDHIDGLWMQVGCYTANAMQLEAGKKPSQLLPCAGEGSNGGRIQMLPAGTEVEGAASPYAPLGAPRISYASPPYSGGLALEACCPGVGRQERCQNNDPAAPAGDQRPSSSARKVPGRK